MNTPQVNRERAGVRIWWVNDGHGGRARAYVVGRAERRPQKRVRR